MDRRWLRTGGKIIIGGALVGAARFLLGPDFPAFLVWWIVLWMLGCTFMPMTSALFSRYDDKGWMFSKVLGVAVCGYATWLIVVLRILPFTILTCMGITVACMAANLWLAIQLRRRDVEVLPEHRFDLIFREEVLFFAAFLLWTYIAGFRPEAYGTEKFMDFGFMQSMMKSTRLPAIDMWYSAEPMNYYYGGQYFAVFLTKLTTTSVEITYNLMRTMIAAFAFVLPFSLVRQMLADRMEGEQRGFRELIASLGGLLAGGAVSLSGNMHYIIYGKVIPLLHTFQGKKDGSGDYWFPDATRYIGHNPETLDRTIHEFPSYSFVLGDLHAHVVNVFFVLTVVGLLYGWLRDNRGKSWRQPVVLACGFFLGIFQFSNTWDFAIYYVVICGTLFFGNLKRYCRRMRRGWGWSFLQWLQVLVIALLAGLPFQLTFDSSMAQGIVLAQNHSAFYQLCVLWALPFLVCTVYLLKYLWGVVGTRPGKFLERTSQADLYAWILALCAMGLVLIPELVYVRDIYEETSARSNTMFKLTYQAYILFGIAMAYILIRFVTARRRRIQQTFGAVMLCALLATFGYIGNAVHSWFGDVLDPGGYRTLDATQFLEKDFPEDAAAIRWLNGNVDGRPVVLEADGDSYSDYDRVSAMTGLPTVFGWYVHEWLWRNDTGDLNEKSAEIETIYTSSDRAKVEALLTRYDVSYIFIGSCEWEKYADLNEELLRSLGTVVFEEGATIVRLK